MIHETCGRCGRKLKTEKSRKSGYGGACLKKVLVEKEKDVLDGQLAINEIGEVVENQT